jgi:hypothetical protein
MSSSKRNTKANKVKLSKLKFTKKDLKKILGGNVDASPAKMDNVNQDPSQGFAVSDNAG